MVKLREVGGGGWMGRWGMRERFRTVMDNGQTARGGWWWVDG
jgi:hypothetical protein